jgi:hypothetical protein
MKTKRNIFYLIATFMCLSCGLLDGHVDGGETSDPSEPAAFDVLLEAEEMSIHTSGGGSSWYWCLWSNGYIAEDISIPEAGMYEISIRMRGTPAEAVWAYAELRIDGAAEALIPTESKDYQVYTATINIAEGERNVAIAFINDRYLPAINEDRNLYVDWIRIRRTEQAPEAARVFDLSVRVEHSDQAHVQWYTTRPATSAVEYGPALSYGNTAGDQTDKKYSHHIRLDGLLPETTYHARVNATDSNSNQVLSDDNTFMTPAFDILIQAEEMSIRTSGGGNSSYWCLWSNGYVAEDIYFPATGVYAVTIRMRGTHAENVWPNAELRVNGEKKEVLVAGENVFKEYKTYLHVDHGVKKFAVAFTNDRYLPLIGEDRNLYIDWIRFTTMDSPRSPELLPIISGESALSISWVDESASGAALYYLERARDEDFEHDRVEFMVFDTTYTDELTDEGLYYYRVRSATGKKENGGVLSDYSATSSGLILYAPTELAATVQNDYVALSWQDNSVIEDGYIMYRREENDEDFIRVGSVASGMNSCIDSSVVDKDVYEYVAVATCAGRESSPSNPARVQACSYSEFMVNTQTRDEQQNPAVARLADGGFVVVWESYHAERGGVGIFGRVYDPRGIAYTDDFQINPYTSGDTCRNPDVVGLRNGSFVVVWEVIQGPEHDHDVYGRLFDAYGNSQGDDFRVTVQSGNTYEGSPRIAATNDEGFFVVWVAEEDATRNVYSIRMQKFNATADPVGNSVRVDSTDESDTWYADIDTLEDASVIITWDDYPTTGDVYSRVLARRFDMHGKALGDAYVVNTTTLDMYGNPLIMGRPKIAGLREGGFVIAWETIDCDGDDRGISARVFDKAHEPISDDFQVNSATEYYQENHSVSRLNEGGFAVAWISYDQAHECDLVMLQSFSERAERVGIEYFLNDSLIENTYRMDTALSRLNDGRLIAVSDAAEDYQYISDIYARYEGSVPFIPVAPSKVNCIQTGEQVMISWEDTSSNESGFRIYRSEDQRGPFTEIGHVPADRREFTDAGCVANTTYYYSLRSFNEAGESAGSFVSGLRVLPAHGFPEEPETVLADDILPYWEVYHIQSQNGIYAIPRMSAYYIGGAVNRAVDISRAHTLSLLVYARESVRVTVEIKNKTEELIRKTILINGAHSWQTITIPISDQGTSDTVLDYIAFSNVSDEFYLAGLAFDASDIYISQPRNIQSAVFDSGAEFYWEAPNVPDNAGYHVYRLSCPVTETIALNGFSFASARISAAPLHDTYYADFTLENGRRYYYGFTTVDTFGNESKYSDVVQVIPPGTIDLEAPVLTDPGSFSHSPVDVALSWNDMSGEGARFYELEIWKGGSIGVLFAREKVFQPSHTVSLSEEGLYTFRVRALSDETVLGGTTSDWSNTVDYVISSLSVPDVPTLIDPGDTDDTGIVTVRWSDESASGARLYYLEYSIDPTFATGRMRSISYDTVDVLTLLENATYYFRVRAATDRIETGGLVSGYSDIVDIKVDRDKSIPLAPTVHPRQTPTNAMSQLITGRKESGTAIVINGVDVVDADPSDQWSAEIALETEGENHFSVQARNHLDARSDSFTFTITRDTTAPVITDISPADGSEITRVPIAVHITSDTADADICVGPIRVYPLNEGKYMGWIDTLIEGENLFTLETLDALGNRRTQGYTLHYRPYIPGPDYRLFCLMDDRVPYEGDLPPVNSDVKIEFQLYNNGDPVQGESISIEVLSGTGTLSVSTATTDAEGIVETVLRTGTDCNEPDIVRAVLSDFLSISSQLRVFSKAGPINALRKLSDETRHYALGASVDLRVQAVDAYQNPIAESPMAVSIDSGFGTIMTDSVLTNESGEASVLFQTDTTVEDTARIRFQSLSESALAVVYTIRTHTDTQQVTVADIMEKVDDSAARIHDFRADVTVTSTADYVPPRATMHIWQKGDLQKVEQYTPEPKVFIRPQPESYSGPLPPATVRRIHSFDAHNNIYGIKTTEENQTAPYPFELDYVDYEKGVIIKTEYYEGEDALEYKWVIEHADFTLLNGCWVFRTTRESFYDSAGTLLSSTENKYSNLQINTGIPDSVFQE